MKEYNKLIRDRIPEIIEDAGKDYELETVEGEDYQKALEEKLQEEVNEYRTENNIEELADIMEVIDSLLACHGTTREELEKLRKEKKQERGGFERGLFLLRAEE